MTALRINVDSTNNKATSVLGLDQPVFEYFISVKYVFKAKNGDEVFVDFSKSIKTGGGLEIDKIRCSRVYKIAVERYEELNKEGMFFYDGQSRLVSSRKLKDENLSFIINDGCSRRANFVAAEFRLGKISPMTVPKKSTILAEKLQKIVSETPKEKVFRVGNSRHYLRRQF